MVECKSLNWTLFEDKVIKEGKWQVPEVTDAMWANIKLLAKDILEVPKTNERSDKEN